MPVQPGSELMCTWLDPFRSCFTGPTFRHVLVLVTGAILTPARRTVTAMLSVVGLSQAPTFTNYSIGFSTGTDGVAAKWRAVSSGCWSQLLCQQDR